jgi:hypothetical protein
MLRILELITLNNIYIDHIDSANSLQNLNYGRLQKINYVSEGICVGDEDLLDFQKISTTRKRRVNITNMKLFQISLREHR